MQGQQALLQGQQYHHHHKAMEIWYIMGESKRSSRDRHWSIGAAGLGEQQADQEQWGIKSRVYAMSSDSSYNFSLKQSVSSQLEFLPAMRARKYPTTCRDAFLIIKYNEVGL